VEQVVAAITHKTKGIPVHLFGQPLDMTALMAIAQSQIAVIEDCAQSTGAEWMGKKSVALDTWLL